MNATNDQAATTVCRCASCAGAFGTCASGTCGCRTSAGERHAACACGCSCGCASGSACTCGVGWSMVERRGRSQDHVDEP